jgi:hypothetical protein
MKNYQSPFVNTVNHEHFYFRCQATANCNATLTSCNTNGLPDFTIQDCQFTVCLPTFATTPTTNGFVVFDCGPGTGPFTADFLTVDTVLGGCTIPGVGVGNLHAINVSVTPDLPDTCVGNMSEVNPDGSLNFCG